MLLVFASHASAQKIYWTAYGQIHRANLDGSNDELLAPGGSSMALDLVECKMYWWRGSPPRIVRGNLDGSGIENVIATGMENAASIALDPVERKVYWIGGLTIYRANYDGSEFEPIAYDSQLQPRGIALDLISRMMYWTVTSPAFTGIIHSELDGSDAGPTLSEGLELPWGIAVDPTGGKLYWADWGLQRIARANLDGTDLAEIAGWDADVVTPLNVALDLPRGKIYWTDWRNGSISRANFDGTDLEPIVDVYPTTPFAVAIDDRVPGDCDTNGEVRLLDHRAFIECFTGPTVEAGTGCLCADANGDRDVDLADYAKLQTLLVP